MLGNTKKRRLLAALFAALTISSMSLFFTVYDPWTEIGPNRITDGQFETSACINEWTGWDNTLARLEPSDGFNQSGGVVLRVAPERNGILRMTVDETENIPAFKVSIRAAAQNIKKGRHAWHIPRAIFFFRDQGGKSLFNLSHGVFNITKDSAWRHYVNVFPVPENTLDGRLQIQNLGVGGILAIDDVSVVPVTPRPSAPFFSVFFILLWIAALAVCLLVLEPWKTLPGIAVLFYALTIIIGVLLPGNVLDGAITAAATKAHDIKQRIERPAPNVTIPSPTTQTPDKKPPPTRSSTAQRPAPPIAPKGNWVDRAHCIGHFILFTILALCSILRWSPAGKPLALALPVTAGLILFAAATETLQFITLDRKAGLSDLGVDVAGILFAISITTLLYWINRLFRKLFMRTE